MLIVIITLSSGDETTCVAWIVSALVGQIDVLFLLIKREILYF
jgi:hypothetical protein